MTKKKASATVEDPSAPKTLEPAKRLPTHAPEATLFAIRNSTYLELDAMRRPLAESTKHEDTLVVAAIDKEVRIRELPALPIPPPAPKEEPAPTA